MARNDVLDAARTVLARNGYDPRHPAFQTPLVQRQAAQLLADLTGAELPAIIGVVSELAAD